MWQEGGEQCVQGRGAGRRTSAVAKAGAAHLPGRGLLQLIRQVLRIWQVLRIFLRRKAGQPTPASPAASPRPQAACPPPPTHPVLLGSMQQSHGVAAVAVVGAVDQLQVFLADHRAMIAGASEG